MIRGFTSSGVSTDHVTHNIPGLNELYVCQALIQFFGNIHVCQFYDQTQPKSVFHALTTFWTSFYLGEVKSCVTVLFILKTLNPIRIPITKSTTSPFVNCFTINYDQFYIKSPFLLGVCLIFRNISPWKLMELESMIHFLNFQGLLPCYSPKNHGISNLVVWRSQEKTQTKTHPIQTPRFGIVVQPGDS